MRKTGNKNWDKEEKKRRDKKGKGQKLGRIEKK